MNEAQYERPWLYPKQRQALFGPTRYAFVEASTKSGKTVGCIAWLFEQAALKGKQGRNYWWIAPTLPVAKIAYRRMKRAIPRQLYKPNDTDCTITLVNGAVLWFKGADRPDLLYGEDVYGAVIDEASRCKEDAWVAVRSTVTATQGAIRIIGNVKGKQNWAYRLARKAEEGSLTDAAFFRLTADDAIAAGVFPSKEVASAKEVMSEGAWKELFYAEAADDGSNPFGLQAIADCAIDPETWAKVSKRIEPLVYGWDVARAVDWNVGIGLNELGHTVRFHRWQHVPWGETKAQMKALNGPVAAWGDSTGVGDSVIEDLQRAGMPVEGYKFSQQSKQLLMERLAGAIQQRQIRFPDGPIRQELETFGYAYSARGVSYSAPEGLHDDCVMALALAVYGLDQAKLWASQAEPEEKPEPDYLNRHPGYDPSMKARKKPKYVRERQKELQEAGFGLGFQMPRQFVEIKDDDL